MNCLIAISLNEGIIVNRGDYNFLYELIINQWICYCGIEHKRNIVHIYDTYIFMFLL